MLVEVDSLSLKAHVFGSIVSFNRECFRMHWTVEKQRSAFSGAEDSLPIRTSGAHANG